MGTDELWKRTYPYLLSTVEAFATEELIRLVDEQRPQSVVERALLAQLQAASRKVSWMDLTSFWKDWFGIDWERSFAKWQQIRVASDIRNAVIHGVSGLSPRQRSSEDIQRLLDDIAMHSRVTIGHDGRIRITEYDIVELENVVRSFILWLDSEISAL